MSSEKGMLSRDNEQLKLLHQEYIEEARKFISALHENAPPKELMVIRKKVRMLLQEIRSFIKSASTSGQF